MAAGTELRAPAAVRSSTYAVGVRLVGAAAGAVALAFIARALPAAEFGALIFGMAMAGLGGTLADFGSSVVATRELAERPDERQRIASGLVVYRLIGTAVIAGPLALTGLLVDQGASRSGFYIVYLMILAQPLISLVAIPTAELRIMKAQIPVIAQSISWTFLAVIGQQRSWNITQFASAIMVSAYVQMVASVLIARTRLSLSEGVGEALSLWKKSRAVGLSTSLFLGYHKGDITLVQGLSGSFQTALYGGAYRLIDTASLAASTLFSGLLPAASRRQKSPDMIRRVALELSGLLGVVGSLVMMIGAGPLVRLFYGSDYAGMIDVVRLGGLVAGAFVIEIALNLLLVAAHVTKPQVYLSAVTLASQVIGVIVVAGRFGAVGAMAVSASVQLIRVVALSLIAQGRGIQLPVRQWFGCSLVGVVSGSIFFTGTSPATAVLAAVATLVGMVLVRPAPSFMAWARLQVVGRRG